MIEVPLRISPPRKVTSPSHTLNAGQFKVLASYLQFPLTGIPTNILMTPSRTYISIIWGVALLIAMAGPMD
jgi:hypothetical protein